MALVSSAIPNLVNGVSQQPYVLRLSSQGELQENGNATVAEGLKKRPPSLHVAKLFDTSLETGYIHVINRDENEQYIVTMTNGDLKVHDIDGTPYVVNFPDGKSYLNSTEASTSFRAVTIADFTFILNNQVTVQEGTSYAATRPYEALVAIRQGNYGKTYRIVINGYTYAEYQTPVGATASDAPSIDTTHIATQLNNNFNRSTGFACYQFGTTLHIVGPSDFSIAVQDGFNGNATVTLKSRAQKFSDLPLYAPENFTIEVVGDPSSHFDNYFVKYVKNINGDGVGVWQETLKPGIKLNLSNATMPHVLVRETNGTFTFRKAGWGERVAGDEESSPFPSFVGFKLADLFFYRNRLGVLSEENVVFSKAGEFFDFFPSTVTTVLDSDPIDIAVSHTKVSILRHAVPFNQELMLFSAQTQFTLEAGELLTPKSVSINQSTEFECSVKVRPVGAGRNVFFCVNKGDWSGVREYFVDGQTKTNDAADVTAHVPRYIPKNPLKIAAATNEDLLAILSADERGSLFIYRYYWSGDEKLQSSWSKWTFGKQDRILAIEFIETKLFVIVARPDGTYLERINVELGSLDGASTPYRISLDRKIPLVGGSTFIDGGAKHTSLTVPYVADTVNDQYAVVILDGDNAGQILDVTKKDGVYRILGNYDGTNVMFGRRYKFKYRFSTPVVKEDGVGGGVQSVTSGRLQIRRFTVTYQESGAFEAIVTPRGRAPYTYRFTGRVTGDMTNKLGETSLPTGQFMFPVMSRNLDVTIDIENDSPLPLTLLNAGWDGYFTNHTQRL